MYELQNRILRLTKSAHTFCKSIKLTFYNKNIIEQLLRSSSSIDANYFEATESISKKERICKLSFAQKEIKESIFWLEMLISDTPNQKAYLYKKEYTEIIKILNVIMIKLRTTNKPVIGS